MELQAENIKMEKRKNSLIISILITLTVVFLNSLGPYLKMEQVTTFLLIPLLGVITFFKNFKEEKNVSFELIVLFSIIAISLFSIYYYVNFESLTRNFSIIIGAFICAFIPISLNRNSYYENYFHYGFIISIIILVIIMYINGNLDFTNFASNAGRRDRFLLNANFYSYISYFANISLFYLYLKNKSRLLLMALIVLPVLFIIVSFTTQSRSGILFILFINVTFWLVINQNNYRGLKGKFKIIFISIALILLSFQFVNIYSNSQVKNRVSNTVVDSREVLVEEAINVFFDNPILGVGLGQFPYYNSYGLFSHNSYTEIMSEHGIIGLILLLTLFLKPFIESLKNLKNDISNPVLKLNVLFFFTFLLYNNAYVFYKATYAMMYFFLVISIQNNISQKENKLKPLKNVNKE